MFPAYAPAVRLVPSFGAPPRSIDELAVEWDRLVTGGAALSPELPFLRVIPRHGGKLFARRFQMRADSELDRLLSYVPHVIALHAEVVPRALARSAAREALHGFGDDLEAAMVKARFAYTSPFLLEGTLAEYLFWYGLHERFHDRATANDAVVEARGLLAELGATDLEQISPFLAIGPWGTWFEPTSYSDLTVAIVHRGRRELTLCCFSNAS